MNVSFINSENNRLIYVIFNVFHVDILYREYRSVGAIFALERPASSMRWWLSTVKQAVATHRVIKSEINWTYSKQTNANTVFTLTEVFQNGQIICYTTVFSCLVSSPETHAVYFKL